MSSSDQHPRPLASDRAVRVLVVDDHAIFRQLISEQVSLTPRFELVGTAATGEQALGLLDETRPDLILLDVHMPGMGGILAAQWIRGVLPAALIVLMTVDPASIAVKDTHPLAAFPRLAKGSLRASTLASIWRLNRPSLVQE
jgi:two-component system, NarL family, nitrate/nitrite response regulator NarL